MSVCVLPLPRWRHTKPWTVVANLPDSLPFVVSSKEYYCAQEIVNVWPSDGWFEDSPAGRATCCNNASSGAVHRWFTGDIVLRKWLSDFDTCARALASAYIHAFNWDSMFCNVLNELEMEALLVQ